MLYQIMFYGIGAEKKNEFQEAHTARRKTW
jgi:hypothetical protein